MKKNIFKKLLYTSLLLVMIFITIVGCEKTEPVTETPIITDTPVVPTPTPIVEYTVTFNSNGGSMISNLKVELNGLITKPTDPTKECHKFLGWYIDESFTTAWDFEKNPVICDMILFAKWEKIESTPEVSNIYNNITKDEVYYGSAYGLKDQLLKVELHNIVEKTHTNKLTYGQVWDALKKADKGEGDNVVCIYTGVLHAFSKQDKGSAGADIWNREHVWPNSKGFGNKSHVAYSDVHHLFASNKNINAIRANKDFADFDLLRVSGAANKVDFGNQWNGTFFEPRDEVKGDIARALFYMVIRYDGDICANCNLDLELVEDSSTSQSNSYDKKGRLGDIQSLIKWHYEDPVSESELARNVSVFGIQGNRNPFIDPPELVAALYYEYAKAYLN